MVIGPGSHGHPFDVLGVIENAPDASGVYALVGPGGDCVYVGESDDIQRRLLEHLNSRTPCLTQHGPLRFTFELFATSPQRAARRDALIAQHRPPCNAVGV